MIWCPVCSEEAHHPVEFEMKLAGAIELPYTVLAIRDGGRMLGQHISLRGQCRRCKAILEVRQQATLRDDGVWEITRVSQ